MAEIPQSLPVEDYKVETTEVWHFWINPEFAEAIKTGVLSVVENPEQLEISQLQEKYPQIEKLFWEVIFQKVEWSDYYALFDTKKTKVYSFISIEWEPVKVESLRDEKWLYRAMINFAWYIEEDGVLFSIKEEKEIPLWSLEYMVAWKNINFHSSRYLSQITFRGFDIPYNDYDDFQSLLKSHTIRIKDFLRMDKLWLLKELSSVEKRNIFESLKYQLNKQIIDERFWNIFTIAEWFKEWKLINDSVTMEELISYEKYFVTTEDKEVYQRAIELMKMKEQKQMEKEQKMKMATEQTRNAISTQLIMQ